MEYLAHMDTDQAFEQYIYQAFEQSAISYWTQNPYKWHYIDFVEDKAKIGDADQIPSLVSQADNC